MAPGAKRGSESRQGTATKRVRLPLLPSGPGGGCKPSVRSPWRGITFRRQEPCRKRIVAKNCIIPLANSVDRRFKNAPPLFGVLPKPRPPNSDYPYNLSNGCSFPPNRIDRARIRHCIVGLQDEAAGGWTSGKTEDGDVVADLGEVDAS